MVKCRGAAQHPSFYTGDLQGWISRNLKADGAIFPDSWPTCFALSLWWNWKWRNNIIFGRSNDIPLDTGTFILDRVSGTLDAINGDNHAPTTGHINGRREVLIQWQAPPIDWATLNTDGASKGTPGPAGGGGVIRDCRGVFTRAFTANFAVCTAFKAELWAAAIGLEMARNMGIKKLILQMDSAVCIEVIKNEAH